MSEGPETGDPVELSEFEYRAFISYSRTDKAFADELYHQLAKYRTPRPLQKKESTLGRPPRRLRVFIDTKGAEAGGTVPDVLAGKIRASAFLIVICSASSKHSDWVNEEIELFAKYNGVERILPVFLRETADTALEDAMPPALTAFGRDIPMGADVLLDGGSSVVRDKLVGAMIGFAQDEIAREQERADERQRRSARRTIAAISALLVCAVALGLAAFDQRQGLLASRSEFLSKQARQALDDGNTRLAQLLAIESIRNTRGALFPAPKSESAQNALIWTLASAPVLVTRPVRDLNPIQDGAITSDGAFFVAHDGQESTLQFFDITTGEMVRRLPDRLGMSISSRGRVYTINRTGFSLTGDPGSIEVYRFDEASPYSVIETPPGFMTAGCDTSWSRSEAYLVYSCGFHQNLVEATTYLVDIETGVFRELYSGQLATSIAVSDDHVAASFGGGRIVLYDVRSGNVIWDKGSEYKLDALTEPEIDFLDNGATLVATVLGGLEPGRSAESPDQLYEEAGVRFGELLIDVQTGEPRARFNGLERKPLEAWQVFFVSNDVPEIYPMGDTGRFAICKSDDCRIWTSSGEFLYALSDAWSFVASASGNLVATWGFGGASRPGASGETLQIYRASDGEVIMTATLDQELRGVRFSDDDRVIAAWGATDALNGNPDLRMWRLPEQTEERFLTRTRLPDDEEVLFSDFRHGGTVVKRGGGYFVRTPGREAPVEVAVDLNAPLGFAFSDDLRQLAVFSEISLAGSGIWDTRSGEKIVQFTSDFGEDAELELNELYFPAPRAAFIEGGARVIGFGNPKLLAEDAGSPGLDVMADNQIGLGAIVWDARTGDYSQSAQEYLTIEESRQFCIEASRAACEEKSACLARVDETCADEEEGYLLTLTDDFTLLPSGEIVTMDRFIEEVSIWQDKTHARRTIAFRDHVQALDAGITAHSIFAEDRSWVVLSTSEGGVLVFDYQDEQVIFAEKVLYDDIMDMSLTSDDRLVLSAVTGEIAVLQLPGGEELWRGDGAARHSLSPDERFLALYAPRDRRRITIIDTVSFLPLLIVDAKDRVRDFYFDDSENEVHIITVNGHYVQATLPDLDDANLLALACRHADAFPAFTETEAADYLISNTRSHSCDRHGLLSAKFYQSAFSRVGGLFGRDGRSGN